MVRGWILFSSLVLGVIFRLWDYDKTHIVQFAFSERTLDIHSWVYFFMEHTIALAFVLCIINPKWLRDTTPDLLLWWFFVILILDFVHYILFFRDEGAGFNLTKSILFGTPLLYLEFKNLWTLLKQ